MGVVDMSNNPPPPHETKDFFPTPVLSLSLAGIFRDGGGAGSSGGNMDTREEVEEASRGGRAREETSTVVEISSENSEPMRSRGSDDDLEHDDTCNEDEEDPNNTNNKKKRKKYHRHTVQQIREMEALFKESPHPDEKQRQQLSKQLGLHPRQVKFWFQNRRTQIKAIQERHENSLLKAEIEKLREENKGLRAIAKNPSCPNCGFASPSNNAPTLPAEEQQLRIENAKLRAEVEKLRAALGKYPVGASPNSSSSCSGGNEEENRSALDFYTGIFGLEKSRIMHVVNQAMEQLKKMAASGEPLWIKSFETGREILNYDEYMKEFPPIDKSGDVKTKRMCIEASRETGVVFMELPRLVQTFMDVNQWKEMFPSIISKAATVDVICNGNEGANSWDGAVQLMFAEVQMVTPVVGTREVYFVRYCKQMSAAQWGIVDVSVDKVEHNIDASLNKCRKLPSGCILQEQSNAHCKVTWVEHLECQKSIVDSLYRVIVNSGQAFGARRWMATLQQQCERLLFFMATNIPTKDTTGVATLAGRKSMLTLAQRMSGSFYRMLGASSYNTWNKVPSKTGQEDIRVASRKNLTDPGEPLGLIVCAVSSIWLPVSRNILFDFLKDENHRHEWDVMSNGGPVQSIANLAKGQDKGNAVSIQAVKLRENNMWILQDTWTNAYESAVVYAPVDIPGMQTVITGCESSNIAVLPSGFSILPDGLESRPFVITSSPEDGSSEGGSLLTVAFQILTSNSPTAKLSKESVESINNLLSCTLHKIKARFQCDNGY